MNSDKAPIIIVCLDKEVRTVGACVQSGPFEYEVAFVKYAFLLAIEGLWIRLAGVGISFGAIVSNVMLELRRMKPPTDQFGAHGGITRRMIRIEKVRSIKSQI